MRPGHSISGHKKAWFELVGTLGCLRASCLIGTSLKECAKKMQDDKEQSTVTIIHDGSSSERELYDKRTDDAIYVSRQVEIART